jgi:hypothetical protein
MLKLFVPFFLLCAIFLGVFSTLNVKFEENRILEVISSFSALNIPLFDYFSP